MQIVSCQHIVIDAVVKCEVIARPREQDFKHVRNI